MTDVKPLIAEEEAARRSLLLPTAEYCAWATLDAVRAERDEALNSVGQQAVRIVELMRELAAVRECYQREAVAWDETSRVLNVRRSELTAELEKAKDTSCNTCGGSPSESGLACICGGSGKASDELDGLRRYAFELEKQLAAARALADAVEERTRQLILTTHQHAQAHEDEAKEERRKREEAEASMQAMRGATIEAALQGAAPGAVLISGESLAAMRTRAEEAEAGLLRERAHRVTIEGGLETADRDLATLREALSSARHALSCARDEWGSGAPFPVLASLAITLASAALAPPGELWSFTPPSLPMPDPLHVLVEIDVLLRHGSSLTAREKLSDYFRAGSASVQSPHAVAALAAVKAEKPGSSVRVNSIGHDALPKLPHPTR